MKRFIISILILSLPLLPTTAGSRELPVRNDASRKNEKIPSTSFSPDVHYALTEYVLSKFQSETATAAEKECAKRCEKILNRAHWRQDYFLIFSSKAHFDNCAFTRSADYINQMLEKNERLFRQVSAAKNEKQRNRLLKKSLSNTGKILHLIQDFYSHTSYVEMMQAEYEQFEDVPDLRLWTDAGRKKLLALEKNGIVSGATWWSFPRQCDKDAPSHKKLSKDELRYISAWLPTTWKKPPLGDGDAAPFTNLEAALAFAENASYQFFAETFDACPTLKSYCCLEGANKN